MQCTKTTSEAAFEAFLIENGLGFEKIQEADTPRPDYLVRASDVKLMFEVKELTEDAKFSVVKDPSAPHIKGYSGIVGDHVRKKIAASRKQIRYAATQGIPSILLVYNNLDPLHLFGTENLDFISAMYGEPTILLNRSTRAVVDAYHGQNQSLREDVNTEFSAVGKLYPVRGKFSVTLFENVFAKVKLPYEDLPPCLEVLRVEITREGVSIFS